MMASPPIAAATPAETVNTVLMVFFFHTQWIWKIRTGRDGVVLVSGAAHQILNLLICGEVHSVRGTWTMLAFSSLLCLAIDPPLRGRTWGDDEPAPMATLEIPRHSVSRPSRLVMVTTASDMPL